MARFVTRIADLCRHRAHEELFLRRFRMMRPGDDEEAAGPPLNSLRHGTVLQSSCISRLRHRHMQWDCSSSGLLEIAIARRT